MLDVRGLPRGFWVLLAGAFVNRLGGFVIPMLAIYLRSDRGFSIEQVTWAITCWGAGGIAAGPAGGFLADRFGRRRTLIVALAVGALTMIHLGLARTPHHVAVAAFLLGVFGEMYRPAVAASLADLVSPVDRVRAFGLLYWAVNLGFAVAAAVGGALASIGWPVVFAADAATTLAFAVVIWRYAPETRPPHAATARPPLWTPLADRRFLCFIVLFAIIWLLFIQAFVTLPLDMHAHGLSPGAYGALISINGVLIVVLQPFAARVFAGWQRYRVLALSFVVIAVGFGLTALARGPTGYATSICIWTLGEIAMAGVGPAVVADVAPARLRGAYQGVFQITFGAAQLAGPVLGGLLLERWGSVALW